MHNSSYKKMEWFRQHYLSDMEAERLAIYDLGSQDVNGSYRPLFDHPQWQYQGIDMAAGKNVDIVLRTPYVWREVATASADVVVSGQAFEHIQYFWITMLEIARVLKPGGVCCILAPSSGPEHRYPVDCWRFYPDGMHALANYAQLEVLEATTQWHNEGHVDGSDSWHDSMLVCRKPELGPWWSLKSGAKRWLQHRALTIGLRDEDAATPKKSGQGEYARSSGAMDTVIRWYRHFVPARLRMRVPRRFRRMVRKRLIGP